jgi:glycosyltransferase involved in cell wall biosynthesis
MFVNSLLLATLVSLGLLLFYYAYFFLKLNTYKASVSTFSESISIIVCAKNEFQNLKDKLPAILNQDYPNYEVIVVNDQSVDDTAVLLKEFEKQYPNLIVVTIERHINKRPGKKLALTLGIKTAKYEHLLLTDADCLPNSKNWAMQMCCNFNSADIVLGYGGYEKKKGLLNKLIRFDTFNVAQQYLSYALAGQTYMGVGRNMAYKKSLFFENKGFANHLHIASGDDDLFIQEIATKNNVSIEITEQAHTTSSVIEKWGEWAYQKRRHITTAPLYKTKFKVLLALYPYAQCVFWTALLLLFLLKVPMQFCMILLGVKIFLSYLVNYKAMKALKVMDLYWINPVYEIVYLCIQGIFVLLNIISKPKNWSR